MGASLKQGLDVIFDRLTNKLVGEEGFLIGGEFAEILLAEPAVAHGDAVPSEVIGADARTLGSRDFDALPAGAAFHPGAIEEAAPSKGSGNQPDIAATDGEDGKHGEVEVLIDARGLVDEKQADAGEAAVGGFTTGESNDAGLIGQEERDLIAAITAAPDAEARQERGGFANQLTGLALGGAHDEDEAFGLMPGS